MHTSSKGRADVATPGGPRGGGRPCHYVMGGVRVEADTTATTVPGLFAAGEVAAGMHGANRLGGNSLSDLVGVGRRAGLYAAEYAKAHPHAGPGNPGEGEGLAPQMRAPFANGRTE